MKTVKQCAEILGISESTIRKHIHQRTDWGRLWFIDTAGHLSIFNIDAYKFPGISKRGPSPRRGTTATKKVGFRVTAQEMAHLEALAKEAGTTVAEWCRAWVFGLDKSGTRIIMDQSDFRR